MGQRLSYMPAHEMQRSAHKLGYRGSDAEALFIEGELAQASTPGMGLTRHLSPARARLNAATTHGRQYSSEPSVLVAELEAVEQEHMKNSKLDPEEKSDALRVALFQQRQYLAYKDTMQRLGVPENEVLSLEKYTAQDDNPLSTLETEAMWSMSDRVQINEKISNPQLPSQEFDTLHPIEDGDNRLSRSMFQDLLELQEEGKLDFEVAGKELDRDPEVLRRVMAPIRKVPPTEIFDSNYDVETTYALSETSNWMANMSSVGKEVKDVLRNPLLYGVKPMHRTHYERGGWVPQSIPSGRLETGPMVEHTPGKRPQEHTGFSGLHSAN